MVWSSLSNPFPASSVRFHITGIVLAAGLGSRFDPSGQRYKLVQQLPDKRPIIVASCASMAPHVDTLIVVVGKHAQQLDEALAQLPATVQRVYCRDASSGMGASLKAGIRGSGPTDGWLIGLGDMPFIKDSTIASVCARLRQGAQIVRPFYGGKPGHPVGLARRLREELLDLPDASGAVRLLQRQPEDVARIDVADAGSVMDIDYPSDLPTRPQV